MQWRKTPAVVTQARSIIVILAQPALPRMGFFPHRIWIITIHRVQCDGNLNAIVRCRLVDARKTPQPQRKKKHRTVAEQTKTLTPIFQSTTSQSQLCK